MCLSLISVYPKPRYTTAIINIKENSIAPKIGELKTYRKNTSALTMIIISNIEKAANTPEIFVNFIKKLAILYIIALI